MPGKGFKALSPADHKQISSKGGKATMLKRNLRFKRWQACTPLERQERGRVGGTITQLKLRMLRLEAIVKRLEESHG